MKRFLSLLPVLFIIPAVLSGAGDSAKDLVDQGMEFFRKEQYFEAVDSFQNAVNRNPYYAEAYKRLSEVYFSLGEYTSSLDKGLSALKYANNDPDILLLIANSYRGLGNFAKAEEYYQNILKRFPGYHDVYRNLAELYFRMNRLSAGRDMLSKADRLNPGYWRNQISFGDYYYSTGDFSKAEEFYKKAFNANQRERQVYLALAHFLQRRERYAEAIRLLETGDRLFENFYSGIQVLAECYLKTGQFQKAADRFRWIEDRGLIKDRSGRSWLYYKLALSLEQIDSPRAVEYYRKAIDTDPRNNVILHTYEHFALRSLRVDSDERRELSRIQYSNAMESYKRGETSLYFLSLKRSVTLYPFTTESRSRLVSFFESRGDNYNLYRELQSLSRLQPDTRVRDKLEKMDWNIKNRQIRVDTPMFYEYSGVILVNSDFYNLGEVLQANLIYLSQYYNKFKFSTLEFRKKQGINYILDHLRKTGTHFYLIVSQSGDSPVMKFTLYDRTGRVLDEYSYQFSLTDMDRALTGFLGWMDKNYPLLPVAGRQVAQGVYPVYTGTAQGYKKGDSLTAFRMDEADITRLSELRLTRTDSWYSEALVVSNLPGIRERNLEYSYMVSSDYINKKDLTKFKRILGY